MTLLVEFVLLSFIIPLISSILLFLLDGKRADLFMLSTLSLSVVLNVIATVIYVASGMPTIHTVIASTRTLGEILGLLIDPMSMCIGFVVATAGYAFMLYSVKYMTPENIEHPVYRGKGRFHGWMMLFIGATLAFIYSSTLLQLLMFFELMSLSCWGVVTYYLTPECRRAGLKAFITTHTGALLGLFTAISFCIAKSISTSLYSLNALSLNEKLVIFTSILIAALAKSAQFPFYSWLPDAMVAPTPATAFLHGAAMVEMGVYLLARAIQFMQPLPIGACIALSVFVSLTLLLTAYLFIPQKDAKRLLAYSTIAESGIMYAGLIPATLGITLGLRASMYLLFTHAYVKGLAFLAAGLFSFYLGTVKMPSIRGLIRGSKFTAFTWIFALLGLAGVPPMPTFFGKLWVVMSLAKAGLKQEFTWIPLIAVIICSSVFFIVSLRWIHNMVLTESTSLESKTKYTPSIIFSASMVMLIIFALVSPFIGYAFINMIEMGSV